MSRFILFIMSIYMMSPAWANSVFNTQNNKLFIPFIQAGEQVFDAELMYETDTGLFTLLSARMREHQLTPTYGETLALSPQLDLHLPRINLDGQMYSADLAYDAAMNRFAAKNISPLAERTAERGKSKGTTYIRQYSAAELQQLIFLFSLQSGININLTVQNGIVVYTLKYNTLNPAGEWVTASALLMLPDDLSQPLSMVAMQHGTEVLDSRALTEQQIDIPSFGLAATGYAVVAADYLGFGASEGLHPYTHAHSLATVVVDAMRAARTVLGIQKISHTDRVFLAGYSEGGYATLALQRELEAHYTDEFTLVASAPMAGAYDLSGTMTLRLLDTTPHPNPYYFPYVGLMLQQVYSPFDGVQNTFAAPYHEEIMSYFDGQHDTTAINAYLPASHLDVFAPQVYADLADPDSWLMAALRANDLTRWTPQSPTRLYHCVKDDQVPFANSQVAFDSFQALGATQVELIPVEDSSYDQSNAHVNCGIPIMLMAKEWFDSFNTAK